jgi:hypothetical protein
VAAGSGHGLEVGDEWTGAVFVVGVVEVPPGAAAPRAAGCDGNGLSA